MGALIGLVMFILQGAVTWDGTPASIPAMMIALLCGLLMIPALPGCGYGMFGVGWTLDGFNFWGGLLRMLCPFTIGMLLSRVFHRIRIKVKGAFWICSIILLLLFHVPYMESTFGGSSVNGAGEAAGSIMLNGVFEAVCILLIFPAIVWLGASGMTSDHFSTRICTFLGDISFPLYIVHYPFMYYFYSWLIEKQLFTLGETWPEALITCGVSVAAAWLCLKFYDLPVRRWLAKK